MSKIQKRRNKTGNMVIVVLLGVLGLLLWNLFNQNPISNQTIFSFKQEENTNSNQLVLEREIANVKLKDSVVKADRFVESISNQIELILYEQIGVYDFSYSKQKDSWYNGLTKSNLSISFQYKMILAIPTSKIQMDNKLGTIFINYSTDDIYCKMIEFSDPLVDTKKGLFGSRYSELEVANIINIEKNKLKVQFEKDNKLKEKAFDNLTTYLSDACSAISIQIRINQELTNNMDGFVEIKNNHPNRYRTETKYLVIHTTNNLSESATAQAHYNYWNNNPNANASANYIVDKDEVIQCVDINKVSWSVENNKWKDNQTVFNNNSISIEMCNNVDFESTMGNTVELIKNQILTQYPNIQIVRHKDATGKPTCPDMTDNEWDNFIKQVYEK